MSLDTTPVRSEVEVEVEVEVGHNLDPREMALEGIVNFRDIGGLQTRDGGVVRTGRIFRSDALHALTAVDIDRLAGLHIATLIDLRTLDEIARSDPSSVSRLNCMMRRRGSIGLCPTGTDTAAGIVGSCQAVPYVRPIPENDG